MPAGRKLQQRDNNSGAIVADTRQRASNVAVDSANVNQANANQNAQAAGNRASAGNAAVVGQSNGKLLIGLFFDLCMHCMHSDATRTAGKPRAMKLHLAYICVPSPIDDHLLQLAFCQSIPSVSWCCSVAICWK